MLAKDKRPPWCVCVCVCVCERVRKCLHASLHVEAGCARNSHAGAPHIIEINLSANDWSTDRDKGGEGKLKACKSMHMNAKNGEKGWVLFTSS